MASSFSVKNYFKKIHTPEILTEFYKQHNIVAIFEITESTPRKNVIGIFMDFYTSLPPEQKIDIEKELALIGSISTKYTPPLIRSLLREKKISEITQLECASDHDTVLYWYIFNKEVFDDALFFHDFYSSRGYMLYEAKDTELASADFAMTELKKEFTRLANKEDNATECDFTHRTLDTILYITMTFDGKPVLSTKKSTTSDTATQVTRKKEEVKIVYLPQDKEVLISFTGPKYEKLIFLDTFLRIVCASGYEGKVESFVLSSFTDETFDFSKTNKGVPLLTWKIKAVTLAFGGNEKQKKKMKLMLPSSSQEYGLSPLRGALEELGILGQAKQYKVENVAVQFSFTNTHKADASVTVSCTISLTKSSLCPLFPYDRFARTLLKQAHIEQGFIEVAKKEKDDVAKKWEV